MIADGKMHERAVGKRQQRFGGLAFGFGIPVEAVLVDGIVNRLGKVGLEFDGGDGNAVEEEHEVDAVFVGERVFDLADDAKAVGGVAGHVVGIDREGGFELGEVEDV